MYSNKIMYPFDFLWKPSYCWSIIPGYIVVNIIYIPQWRYRWTRARAPQIQIVSMVEPVRMVDVFVRKVGLATNAQWLTVCSSHLTQSIERVLSKIHIIYIFLFFIYRRHHAAWIFLFIHPPTAPFRHPFNHESLIIYVPSINPSTICAADIYAELVVRSTSQGQGQVITSHRCCGT